MRMLDGWMDDGWLMAADGLTCQNNPSTSFHSIAFRLLPPAALQQHLYQSRAHEIMGSLVAGGEDPISPGNIVNVLAFSHSLTLISELVWYSRTWNGVPVV
jgi:hypothetical protein